MTKLSWEETARAMAASPGEAKFWLQPKIVVAANYGLSRARLDAALKLVQERGDEIRAAWQTHFGR
jgi:hypothetical protein